MKSAWYKQHTTALRGSCQVRGCRFLESARSSTGFQPIVPVRPDTPRQDRHFQTCGRSPSTDGPPAHSIRRAPIEAVRPASSAAGSRHGHVPLHVSRSGQRAQIGTETRSAHPSRRPAAPSPPARVTPFIGLLRHKRIIRTPPCRAPPEKQGTAPNRHGEHKTQLDATLHPVHGIAMKPVRGEENTGG